MACLSVVRIAGPKDYEEIWRLFLQGHRENGQFSLAPEKVDWLLARALQPESIEASDTGPRGIIGVIGPVGALEAIVFVTIGALWYSDERLIGDNLVYVDPECRRSRHARALIFWMKQQSQETGLRLLTGVVSNTRTKAKVSLYNRMLPQIGGFFLYDPATAVAV